MKTDNSPTRTRVKLAEGDLFEFAVPDGRTAYGIILKRGVLKNGGAPYIAIFRSLFDKPPDLDTIVRDGIALAGWTTDALVYHGQWKIVARALPLPKVSFPNFKVEQEGKIYVTDVDGMLIEEATGAERDLLDYEFSRAPIGFQNAFEALYGFQEWKEHYEKLTPAYFQARSIRRKK